MPGAQSALFATFMCIAGPGQEVILLEPAYATYDGVVMAGGADAVRVPLDAKSNFGLDLSRIEAAVTEKTCAVLLNSPGNPTGTVFKRKDVAELASFCRERGIWLVSDEVYSTLVYDGDHVSPFQEPGADDHVIVINSLSKAYAMTGWRIGWVIAPSEVIDALSDLAQCSMFGVCQFTQDAATVALQDGETEKNNIEAVFKGRRDALYNCLSNIEGIGVYKPEGGMFLLADISATGMNGDAFANALLDEVGVAVVPGAAFGDSVENFVRIGFLSDEAILIEAAQRIEKFMNKYIG
jgi:aspartate/methionine/tyrosine aminotransferase